MYVKRIHYSLCLYALLAVGVSHAGSIDYTVSDGSAPNSQRFTYRVSGITLATNQELDILFSPALFSGLANGTAGSGFDVMLFQPNNPLGTFGHFSALALTDHASISSPFGVDVFLIGTGLPGSQPFRINQFDSAGNFVAIVQSGFASQVVPEPGGYVLIALFFSGIGAWRATRRYPRQSL